MSPLSDSLLNIDLVGLLQPLRLVIVVADRLGAIHQTLATIAAANIRRVLPAGIVLCETTAGTAIPSNAMEIAKHTQVPIVAQIPFGATCKIAVERLRSGEPT